MSQADVLAPRLPMSTKLIYGLGSVAYGAKNQLMSGLLLLYYNQLVGLPAQMVSLAVAITIVVDAIWDPSVGQFSDTFRSKWGRRHPFMYFSAIPFAICWALLWHPPEGWGDWALFSYVLVLLMASRLLISLYEVPSSALAPELAPDYVERTELLGYRYMFGTLGGVGAAILAYAVFLKSTPELPMGQLNKDGYFPYAVTVAVIMMASIFISTAGTHHKIPSLHQPPVRKVGVLTLLREVGVTLSNRNFAIIVAAGIFSGMSGALSQGLQIYFSTYFWELPSSMLLIVTLGGLISSPAAAIIAPLLTRRYGKKLAAIGLFVAGLVVSLGPITARLMGLMPPNGSDLLVGILLVDRIAASSLGIGGFIILASMVADIVEDNQVRTGRRSEALLMSADNLLQKIVGGMAAILPGLLLAFVAFPAKARPGFVDPEVLRNLALIYLPAVALLSGASIFTLHFYRIDKGAHERNLATLKEAAAAAEARIEATDQPASPEGGGPDRP